MAIKTGTMYTEMDVNAEPLSQGLDQASNELDQFQNKLLAMSTSALDAQLAALESQFKGMESVLAALDAKIDISTAKLSSLGMTDAQIATDPGIASLNQQAANLSAALDIVTRKIEMTKTAISGIKSTPIEEVKSSMNKVGDSAVKAGKKMEASMGSSIKKLTKFGALLLGVRTIYSAISRAVNSYITGNDILQAKINGMFTALGNLLAPAIETVVGWMVQLVQWVLVAAAYISKFLNVMLGWNIGIKKSITGVKNLNSGLKDTGKELNNLAGFDQLNVLQSPDTSGSASAAAVAPDMSVYDISKYLVGLDNFAKKLETLKPILLPVITYIGYLAIVLIALNAPMAGVAIAVGIIIGLLIFVISKWDTLSESQRTALTILGLITAAIIIFAIAMAIANAAMAPQVILFGLIALGIAAIIAIIVILIVYWDKVTKAVSDFASNTWNWISTLGSNIGKTFDGVWKGITDSFSTAWNGVKSIFSGVWNWILGVMGTGGQIFNGVVDGVAGVFKTVVNTLISGINTIISIPFKTINGLLNTIRGINILGVSPFVGLWGQNPLPVPQIPKLATGTVATSPMIAQIGEGKYDEAVIPLGNSPQFADMKSDIADDVVERLGGNSSNGDTVVIMQMDGEKYARATIKNINKLQRKAGRTLLEV